MLIVLRPDVQVDLCHGPHLPNTGLLKATAVSAVNRAHWRADVNNEPLQVILRQWASLKSFCIMLQSQSAMAASAALFFKISPSLSCA